MTDWVTQHEFSRLEGTVNEIYSDVKTLLAVYHREEGAHEERKELLEATRDKGARRLGWGAIAVASLTGFTWVQDALSKLIHN